MGRKRKYKEACDNMATTITIPLSVSKRQRTNCEQRNLHSRIRNSNPFLSQPHHLPFHLFLSQPRQFPPDPTGFSLSMIIA